MRAGFELVDVNDAHICCGSAGTYSLLQNPRLAGRLRNNKLANLMAGKTRRHRHRERRLPDTPGRRGRRARTALGGVACRTRMTAEVRGKRFLKRVMRPGRPTAA